MSSILPGTFFVGNKILQSILIGVSLGLCLLAYQFYIYLASPQVPYMDTMRFLVQIEQILKGELSWIAIYNTGEHRGLIYPVVILFEWIWWGVDARLTTILTGFVVAATFLFWLKALWQSHSESSGDSRRVTFLILGPVCALLVASPAGFELWTLDLGFAQLIKNLLIIMFLYHLAHGNCWVRGKSGALVVGLAGAFLILFCTYGWSYPFFAASVAVLVLSCVGAPQNTPNAFVVLALMLIAQVVYVYSGSGIFSNTVSMTETAFSLVGFAKAALYGAGTVFIGAETQGKLGVPVIVPMGLGMLLFLMCLVSLLLIVSKKSAAGIFLCGLIMFSLTVLAGVAVARGGVNFADAGASRYFVDFIWLLLAPAAIIFTANDKQSIAYPILSKLLSEQLIYATKVLMGILFICALVGQVYTWREEIKTAPYRAATFNSMADVYWNGVSSQDDAALLQAPLHEAERAVDVAQAYNLATFRSGAASCAIEDNHFYGEWSSPEGGARWMGKSASFLIERCRNPIRIKGYIPENFIERHLRITYGEHSEILIILPGEEFSITLADLGGKNINVDLTVDAVTNPADEGLGVDGRNLGLLITYIGK